MPDAIEWNETDKNVFKEYGRHIVHMIRQFHTDHLGLIFGAGISTFFKIPLWSELNRKIATDSEVDGVNLCDDSISDPMLTKRLFEHYKNRQNLTTEEVGTKEERKKNLQVIKNWIAIMHKHLYSNVSDPNVNVSKSHTYLGQYLKIIRNSSLTVNYNFDDFLETMLLQERSPEEKESTKGYQSVTNLTLSFRKKNRVIYHPNGFLPNKLSEKSSSLIFGEDEFADQLIGVISGHYSALMQHLCSNTCLFIGVSLEDSTLKHLLRQSSRLNPAHCHYYIQYYEPGKSFTDEQKAAIRSAYFETYNLITLFLNDKEIASLGKIIESGFGPDGWTHNDIDLLATETGVPSRYIYYIVGAIGVGKSTAISHFRDMITYDEWTEPRDLELGKEPESVSTDKLAELDNWIAKQFRNKNTNLYNELPGIVIVDRCPLDPISFTEYSKWKEKGDLLGNTMKKDIRAGHIIMLKDDPAVLELRTVPTYKEYSEDRLKRLQNDLIKLYCMDGITIIDTKYMTYDEVMKEVACIIHMQQYKEIDIQGRLVQIKNNGAN